MTNSHHTSRLNRRHLLNGITTVGATLAARAPAQAALLPAGIRTEKHDVIVIGAGTAGLVAALQARQGGADVLALEKTPENTSGGDSRMSGGIFFLPGSAPARRSLWARRRGKACRDGSR